ncbi:MAG TPA: glycoside hydrolase family 2 TIM barrel-domain containing protein [Mycobacteriales bacterium]
MRVEGTLFLINDEPFYFRGFGKHEDLNVHGRGHDDAAMLHDFSLLAWIGANSFRTSHYPYAEEVLEEADLGVGGGMFLGGPRTTYSDETISAATQQVHRRAIEELIARDRTIPASSSGAWPTSPSPIPMPAAHISSRCSRRPEMRTPAGPWGSST